MHKLIIIILFFLGVTHINGAPIVDGPSLFNKNQKVDRLVLKNQIVYHFKKKVKPVAQELFVSRRIDVTPLFQGIYMLQQTRTDLDKYCKGLNEADISHKMSLKTQQYYIIPNVDVITTFAEAKAMCHALGMQLPEIYTNIQRDRLSNFMYRRNIKNCFAGIQPDPNESLQRFISTGMPIWRSPHEQIFTSQGDVIAMKILLDDVHAKFLYNNEGKLIVTHDNPSVAQEDKPYGHKAYWDKASIVSQLLSNTICEPRWDGEIYSHFQNSPNVFQDISFKNRYERSIKPYTPDRNVAQEATNNSMLIEIRGLRELCESVSSQADELEKDMDAKLRNLLSLVDISVQMEQRVGFSRKRKRRAFFLANFIFSTGIKVIWNLFGLIQKIKMNNRIKKLEANLFNTQGQVTKNKEDINNMSSILYGQSIAIQQLNITTADLSNRVTTLEQKVDGLTRSLHDVVNKLEATISLNLVSSLIQRIQHSMNTGYDILKDIIHCSLLGQTSPLLLPMKQIDEVQQEVRKTSEGVLDADFLKMQSVIVSDPSDPKMLIVIINVAALSQKSSELVQMIPVPYFENGKAYAPVLDYTAIILDQVSRTYSILNPQEEHDCLTGRCYISDAEHSLNEKTCGIPQLLETKPSDICLMEEVTSTGVFIKPMLPDGIVFAFQEVMSVQLFCQDDKSTRPPKQLGGIGIIQIQPGCTLSVVDDLGRNTVVKGQPVYRMIEASEIDLSANSPLISTQTTMNNVSRKNAVHSRQWTEHMHNMIQQVQDVDSKLESQSQYIWGLIGLITFIFVGISVTILVAYRFSTNFRNKIRFLREKFMELQLSIPDVEMATTVRPGPPPVAPRLNPSTLAQKVRTKAARFKSRPMERNVRTPSPYVSVGEISEREGSYMSFKPIETAPATAAADNPIVVPSMRRYYPSLSQWRITSPAHRLSRESKEVEDLCNMKSVITPNQTSI